ncbi:MAG: DUF1353 domain-containing protein [Smithella sp.]
MFLNDLDIRLTDNDLWVLAKPLRYYSRILNSLVIVPEGFITDLASVPRLPIVYDMWGDRAHREAVIHDFLYCCDCNPVVTRGQADQVFLEAMKVRKVFVHIRYPMFWAVRSAGWCNWHKRKITEW